MRTPLPPLLGTFAAIVSFGELLYAAGLNDTGQTKCYDVNGTVVSCSVAPAGDDGRYGRDAAAAAGALRKTGGGAAGFDFTKIANNGSELPPDAPLGKRSNEWACTRDNVTSLTWEVKTTGPSDLRYHGHRYWWYDTNDAENGGNRGSTGNGSTCNGTLPSNQCNTQAFVQQVNATRLCGFNDWRLPTPSELRSIIHYGDSGGAIALDPNYLPNAPLNRALWTSATYAPDPADAWVVEIGELDGGGGGHNHSKSAGAGGTGDEHTMLVRGPRPPPPWGPCTAGRPNAALAQSTPGSDFVDHGDGTVTHLPTGLMWKRCVEGRSGPTCITGQLRTFSWPDALAAAEMSTFAGYTDWRVPNVKELKSIIETCGYDPAINQVMFPNTPLLSSGSIYWTSTSSAPRSSDVWVVVFDRGGAVVSGKGNGRSVIRLVRRGQPLGSFDAQNPSILGPRRRAVRK